MSHFAVAVFSNDCDFYGLLAPYNVGDQRYYTFHQVKYDNIVERFNAFRKQNAEWNLDMYIDLFHYTQNKDGQWGYMENPNGFWDYYSLDGKDYLYDLKDDADLGGNDYYRKNDYDWFPDTRSSEKEEAEFWDEYIAQDRGYPPGIWSREYYLERFKTKEQYVKEMCRVIPWAFITPDGVWHSAGTMGWFCQSDETAEDADRYAQEWYEYIQSEDNPYVSIVDCHI